MSQFLLRQAARLIAGSAAPQVASQIAQRLGADTTRDADRRRFLIWLSGPFKQARPDAYDQLWPRLNKQDPVINALTGVFLELQSAGPSAMTDWFAQLAESDEQQFNELIAAMQPKSTNAQQLVEQAQREAGDTVRGAARMLGRAYRETSRAANNEVRKRKR